MPRATRRLLIVLALLLPALVLVAPQAQARTRAPGLTVAGSAVQTAVAAFGAPLPFCYGPHTPYGQCGYASVDLTLKGFAALGGIPECDSVYCDTPGVLSGKAEVKLTVRCADRTTRRITKAVPLTVPWQSWSNRLNISTRDDADTATFTLGATLVDDTDRELCGLGDENGPAAISLVAGTLRRVELTFDGAGAWPSMTTRLPTSYALVGGTLVPVPSGD